jgi:hypothetical protein
MHIDPLRDIPAICAGHIVLTFISNTVEPLLNNNVVHPNEPTTTAEPSPTQPEPDDEPKLLYPTPPPSPEVQPSFNHNAEYGLGTLHDQICETVHTNKITVQDHEVYYSTMYWPSNQQQPYQDRQLSTRSRHVQPDYKTTPEDWSMDTDIYSDDSYDYTNTSSPKLSTDWYDQTATNIDYRLKTATEYDNVSHYHPASQLTTISPTTSMGWDNYTNDTDHEPAASVMLTTTLSPLMQHELTLPQQYNTKPPLSPLIWNAQTANDDEGKKEISTSDQYITNDK